MQLRLENSLFVISKILRLFVNTLSANNRNFFLNRGNLLEHFQMQLSQKRKLFSLFFFVTLKFRFNLTFSEKRWPSLVIYFGTYGLGKTWLDKCLKNPVSEDPSTSNMVNGPNHCWNLRDSTFTLFIDTCSENLGWKTLS